MTEANNSSADTSQPSPAATVETVPDWKQDQAETSRLPRQHLDASKWPSKAAMEASHARLSAATEDETVEGVARTICISYGRDPDEMTSIIEMCTADNKPVPLWRVYEEQAEAVVRAHITVLPQPPRETELLESASTAIGALLQWTSNWTVPFEGEDEWLVDKDVALRVRDQIASLLTRPQPQS